MTQEEVFGLLQAEAERLSLPEYFKGDLFVHDRARLADDDVRTEFYWVLRTCGTHLHTPAEFSKHRLLANSIATGDINQHWYHFKDGVLTPIEKGIVK